MSLLVCFTRFFSFFLPLSLSLALYVSLSLALLSLLSLSLSVSLCLCVCLSICLCLSLSFSCIFVSFWLLFFKCLYNFSLFFFSLLIPQVLALYLCVTGGEKKWKIKNEGTRQAAAARNMEKTSFLLFCFFAPSEMSVIRRILHCRVFFEFKIFVKKVNNTFV